MVSVGSTIVLACVGYGVPAPSINWTRDGSVLMDNPKITFYVESVSEHAVTFVQSVVEICNTQSSDAGTYACTVDNGVSGDSIGFGLRVIPQGGE